MGSQSFDYWMSQGHRIPSQQQHVALYDVPPDMSNVPTMSESPASSIYDHYSAPLHNTYYPHIVDESMQFGSYHMPLTPPELGSDQDSPYCSPQPMIHTESVYMPGATSLAAEKTHTTSGRRRAQNRAAQRAFRERKEKHAHDLEVQLTALTDRYNQLEVSHIELNAAYEKLRKTIELLTKDDDANGDDEQDKDLRRKSSSSDTMRKLLDILHGEIKSVTPGRSTST